MAAILIGEAIKSRARVKSASPRAVLLYKYFAADPDEAITAAESDSPTSYSGLRRASIEAEPFEERADIIAVRVDYEGSDSPDDEVSFEIGGANEKIFKSLETASYGPTGRDDAVYGHDGLIGVTKDSVEGLDVPFPVLDFSITKYYEPAAVDDEFLGALHDLAWHTNSNTWRTFEPGELVFKGASGTRRGTNLVPITYRLGASPNLTRTYKVWKVNSGLELESADVEITKRGWERLDPETRHFPNDKSWTQRAIAYHVHKIFEEGDFSLIPSS